MERTKGEMKADIRTGCLAVYPSNLEKNCLSHEDNSMICFQMGRGEHTTLPYKIVTKEQEANANYIAKSWNSHKKLVGALRLSKQMILMGYSKEDDPERFEIIQQALKSTEGG